MNHTECDVCKKTITPQDRSGPVRVFNGLEVHVTTVGRSYLMDVCHACLVNAFINGVAPSGSTLKRILKQVVGHARSAIESW
jgi:hypothetical protein